MISRSCSEAGSLASSSAHSALRAANRASLLARMPSASLTAFAIDSFAASLSLRICACCSSVGREGGLVDEVRATSSLRSVSRKWDVSTEAGNP